MTSNKRSYAEMQDENKIEIDSFDGKIELESFREYIEKIKSFKNVAEDLIKKRKKEKIPDSDTECQKMSNKIKDIKHNLNYNIFHLRKIINTLKDFDSKFRTNVEDLCDHDIYSECEYHNDRYYYCKKCTYER